MAWVHSLFARYSERSRAVTGRLLRVSMVAGAALATVPLAAPAYATAGSFSLVTQLPAANSFPGSIVTGPDHNLWFAESGKIGRISTAGALQEFALPAGHNARSIAPGPDGRLWFTEPANGRVGSITTDGATISEYLLAGNSGYGTPVNRPQQIVAGPDGQLWFTQTVFSRSLVRTVGGQIDSITTGGTISTRLVLASGGTKATTAVPDAITVGPDQAVWFTDTQQGRVERVNSSGPPSVFTVPAGSPAALTSGPDGKLWLTANFFGAGGSRVYAVTTAGAFSAPYLVPADSTTNGDSVGAIAVGSDANIWFTNYDMFSSLGSIWRLSRTMGGLTRFKFSESREIDGLAGGPDRGLWFTTTDNSTGNSAIGRMATS
jgi:sugar lactone lactonase YvrE